MTRTRTFPEPRTVLYVDDAAVKGEAEMRADPSLRRLDLRRMARKACPSIPVKVVWIGSTLSLDDVCEDDVGYESILRDLGIECRTPMVEAPSRECLRCGHGWEDDASASAVSLTLSVMMDASCDAFDRAIIFADPRVGSALQAAVRTMFPHKLIERVQIGRSARLAPPGERVILREDAYRACRLPDAVRRQTLSRPAARSTSPCVPPLTYFPS